LPVSSGLFVIDRRVVLVMFLHLLYSLVVYLALRREPVDVQRIASVTIGADIVFGAVFGMLTEGATSPAYVFFAFVVVAAGLRAGLRQAILVTLATVAMYAGLILVSIERATDMHMMRPVYLAIAGFVVGYLGQRRLELHDELRRLESIAQRHRIGRDLHDNFSQALAGINLRLEGCRKRLRADPQAEVLTALSELQESVKREYDELRTYTRALAGIEPVAAAADEQRTPRMELHVDVVGPVELLEHVLQIVREGMNNVRLHSGARRATIQVATEAAELRISIDDDGAGMPLGVMPWSIASRVREIGGELEIVHPHDSGAHLRIRLPRGEMR
jgi:signal transduction histidine kinase